MEERELRRLAQKRKLLWKRVAEIEEFLRGSVVLMKRRCIFAGCRKCASGERHPTWVLTVHQKGKTQTVYVGKSRLAEAKRLVGNYRRARTLMEEVAQVNLLLFRGRHSFRKGSDHEQPGQGP
jgi:hypothetical protein